MPIEDLYHLRIVGGVLAEVYLSVLRIAQFDTIVEDTNVVDARAANVDRLESTDPAEVLDLNAREEAECIGYGEDTERFELLP